MIGIRSLAKYIPEKKQDNRLRTARHGVNESFLLQKIGFRALARIDPQENASDLCVKAYERLTQCSAPAPRDVDAIIVCTQTPDGPIPHVSAIVHGLLGCREECATFDVSLGCSGYPATLSVARSFAQENRLKNLLLFTADPYSKIVDQNDKNTDLLFGDAATVTWIGEDPLLEIGRGAFRTVGVEAQALHKKIDSHLFMDGRAVYNFVMREGPKTVQATLAANAVGLEQVDRFLFHQASRFMHQSLCEALGVVSSKAPFDAAEYGNTVSSSIPILLEGVQADQAASIMLLCGFGVGLSAAGIILRRCP